MTARVRAALATTSARARTIASAARRDSSRRRSPGDPRAWPVAACYVMLLACGAVVAAVAW